MAVVRGREEGDRRRRVAGEVENGGDRAERSRGGDEDETGLLPFRALDAALQVALRLHVIVIAERFRDAANGFRSGAEKDDRPGRGRGLLPRLRDVRDLFAFTAIIDEAAAVEDAIVRGQIVVAGIAALRQPHDPAARAPVGVHRDDAADVLVDRPENRI